MLKPERDPELTLCDRTSLDDVRLIKIIHGLVLDLRHEEKEAKRENLSILSGLMNMRYHRASS